MYHQISESKEMHDPTEGNFGFSANYGTHVMNSLVLCRSSWTECAAVVVIRVVSQRQVQEKY